MTRREAREAAFLLLFEQDFKRGDPAEETLELAAAWREMKISGFGRSLFTGAAANLGVLDAHLEKALINWKSERVSRAARTALRLCAYEMMFTETDAEVAINEAIELVKKFDGGEGASFVNGVIGGVYKAVAEKEKEKRKEEKE